METAILKAFYQLTLVDLSPGILAVSQALNPECEHLHGLGRDQKYQLGEHCGNDCRCAIC